jgi:hypothetical protein
MSVKDIEFKPGELWQYYMKLIDGLISENDLAATQKAQLLSYATKQQNKSLSFINEMIMANPGTTFEYWSQRLENYINANKAIALLEPKHPTESTPPTEQKDSKLEPEQPGKRIIFKDAETIDKIHSELKGFFDSKETELLEVLKGNSIPEFLLFPHNQNKFVEVFRRLKYNGYVLNNLSEIRDWICSTFMFVKNGNPNTKPFNESTVYDILKGKSEPTKKERICTPDWLPHKSKLKLDREAEKEKL